MPSRYTEIPYDIVLTNQLVASVERGEAVVYSALRGGVTLGGTMYNRRSTMGTFSFDHVRDYRRRRVVQSMRGDDQRGPEQMTRDVALVILHELGHQLFHYADLFDVRACVMQPVRVLCFQESASAVVSDGCPKNHPQMQRGAAELYYWPQFLN